MPQGTETVGSGLVTVLPFEAFAAWPVPACRLAAASPAAVRAQPRLSRQARLRPAQERSERAPPKWILCLNPVPQNSVFVARSVTVAVAAY